MGSEKNFVVFLSTFAILAPLVFALRAADPLCTNVPADEIVPFPHEWNCSLYYECFNGNKTTLVCPDDLYYNNRTQSCDYQDESGCTNGEPPACWGVQLDYLPYPGDCSKYLECYQGSSYLMSCPTGYYFDSTSKKCVLPADSDCAGSTANPSTLYTTPDPLCFGVRPNQTVLIRYPGDCRKYWKCYGSQLSWESCSGNLLFDENRQLCDFPEVVDCDDSTRTADPGTSTTIAPPTDIPNTSSVPDADCSNGEVSYWPYPDDCSRFIECYNGVSYIMDCPWGLYFSENLTRCVDPRESECGRTTVSPGSTVTFPSDWTPEPDCPWPGSEGLLLPYPGDCTRYYECNFGNKVEMPCPAGLWFHEAIQECDYPYQAECQYATLSLWHRMYRIYKFFF